MYDESQSFFKFEDSKYTMLWLLVYLTYILRDKFGSKYNIPQDN